MTVDHGPRLRSACQAPVAMGEVSRGGLTRGDPHAWAHALGLHEPDMPCGLVDEDSAQLPSTCGRSAQPRACSVDALEAWWAALEEAEPVARARLQINMENGPERSGMRPQVLHRMVPLADQMGQPIPRLSSPP